MENQVEKKMEHEMETREYIGIVLDNIGIIIGILNIKALKKEGVY